MRKMMDGAMTAGMTLLGVALIGMVALSVYNVISRYVFSAAVLWADEVAVFALIAVTWAGGVICAWRGLDIRMSILVDLLPRTLRRPVAILHQVVIAGICGWVAWLSWGYVARVFRVGMVSDTARVPMWLVHSAMTVSLALIGVIAVVRLINLLAGGNGRLAGNDRDGEIQL